MRKLNLDNISVEDTENNRRLLSHDLDKQEIEEMLVKK